MILESDRLECAFVLYFLPAVWPWKSFCISLCLIFRMGVLWGLNETLMKCLAQCLEPFNKWQFLLPILGQPCPISIEPGRKKGGRRHMECSNRGHHGERLLEWERGKGPLGRRFSYSHNLPFWQEDRNLEGLWNQAVLALYSSSDTFNCVI